jgi:hypothetical protein
MVTVTGPRFTQMELVTIVEPATYGDSQAELGGMSVVNTVLTAAMDEISSLRTVHSTAGVLP